MNEKLVSSQFPEFLEGMKEFFGSFPASTGTKPDDADFILSLRPFYWYLHNPGFQDIHDQSRLVLELLSKYESQIDEYDYQSLVRFFENYLSDGNLAGSEIGVTTSLKSLLEKMNDTPDRDIIENYLRILDSIISAKYLCYDNLREMGNLYTNSLADLTITLTSADADFILHALDGFTGDEKVIGFYEKVIAETDNDNTREYASDYLSRVRA
jgi:hypothetical protein